MMQGLPRMKKDLRMDDPVEVTLPAYIWYGFASSYAQCDWNNADANRVAMAAQEAILDPVFKKELDAAHAEQVAQYQSQMQGQGIFGLLAQLPYVDPNDPRFQEPE